MLLLGKVSVCVCASSTLKSSQAAELPFYSFPLNHLSFTASLASSKSRTVKLPVWTGVVVGVSPALLCPGWGLWARQVLLLVLGLQWLHLISPKQGWISPLTPMAGFCTQSETWDVWKLRTSAAVILMWPKGEKKP